MRDAQGNPPGRQMAIIHNQRVWPEAKTHVTNNGYDLERAQSVLTNGDADLVAFGIPFLANPDLVERYKNDLPLNEADQVTFYGGDEAGYTDYPFADTAIAETA